jgi:hypothetical protein
MPVSTNRRRGRNGCPWGRPPAKMLGVDRGHQRRRRAGRWPESAAAQTQTDEHRRPNLRGVAPRSASRTTGSRGSRRRRRILVAGSASQAGVQDRTTHPQRAASDAGSEFDEAPRPVLPAQARAGEQDAATPWPPRWRRVSRIGEYGTAVADLMRDLGRRWNRGRRRRRCEAGRGRDGGDVAGEGRSGGGGFRFQPGSRWVGRGECGSR